MLHILLYNLELLPRAKYIVNRLILSAIIERINKRINETPTIPIYFHDLDITHDRR